MQKNINLGTNVQTPGITSHPYLIFYNRFTGLLRVFLTVNTNGNAYQKANVQLYFSNEGVTTGAFSTVGYPVALDKATNKSLHSIVNAKNTLGEWFVAEFPIMYDPCTCKKYSELIFKVSMTQESKLTGTIATSGTIVAQDVAIPQGKNVTLGNISLKDVGNLGKNVMESYNNMNKFKTSMLETQEQKWEKIKIDIQARPNPVTGSLQAIIQSLKVNEPTKSPLEQLVSDSKTASFMKSGLSALPYIGAAISLIDFFTGGGQAAGPQEVKITPMAIKMNSELTATIVKTDPWSDVLIANPGSDQTLLNSKTPLIIAQRKPVYNNIMGVVNLLYTPTIAYRRKSRVIPFSVRQDTWNIPRTISYGNRYTYNRTVYDYDFKIINSLSMNNFVVNPAHKMAIQDVKGAIVVEGKISDASLLRDGLGTGNLQFDSFDPTEKTYGYRTEYTDFGCLPKMVAKTSDIIKQGTDETLDEFHYLLHDPTNFPYDFNVDRASKNMPYSAWEIDKQGMDDVTKKRVFLKLIINFRRTDDPNAQNVLWVGKFPVDLVERASNNYPWGISSGEIWDPVAVEAAWNTSSAGCSRTFGVPNENDPYNIFAPATPDWVDSFCSSPQYLNNSASSGRVAAEEFQDWDNNGGCTSPTPTIAASSSTVPSTLTASGCSGTVNWSTGASGNSITVSTAGTYTANCTNSPCAVSSNGSVTVTNPGGGSCNYTQGQFMTEWLGNEVIRAYICGTKFYAKNDAGDFKSKTWLTGTGRFTQAELDCFEENDPRPAGCGTGGCTSPTPTISASSSTVPSTLTASGCSGIVNWSTGASGNSITVSTAGTYTANCTNPSCTASGNGSVTVTNPGGSSCNYTEGQFMTEWFGNEVIRAYICGTKFYAKNNSGDFKSKAWLTGTGRFTQAELDCFEENDPRPAGCGGGGCTSPTPTISASSSTVPSTLTASGCSGTVNWSTGASGNSITVSTAGTYTATCTNPPCTVSGSGSVTVTNSGGGSCNYTNGQFMTEWFGNEVIRAYICGTKFYAKNDAGYFKSKSWLTGTGRFTQAELDCFEEVNPGCGGLRIAAIEEETDNKVTIYPNPTTGKVKLVFSLQKAENVWLNLYDTQGKSLDLRDFEGKAGRNEMEYDLQNYPSGAYFVNFQSSEKREVLKVMKVN